MTAARNSGGSFAGEHHTDRLQRARYIAALLQTEYPDIKPFLTVYSPFQLLIAVILSAQTTDRQVNALMPNLFKRCPDAATLAATPLEEVIELVRSVGFFRVKARNIRETARLINEKYNDVIPDTMEELLTLPGVGRKSANVVLGAVYHKPAIIVDTHFGRVMRRLCLTESKNPEKIEYEIERLLPAEQRYPFTMSANLHGRLCCVARKPHCAICPLRALCPYQSERDSTQ